MGKVVTMINEVIASVARLAHGYSVVLSVAEELGPVTSVEAAVGSIGRVRLGSVWLGVTSNERVYRGMVRGGHDLVYVWMDLEDGRRASFVFDVRNAAMWDVISSTDPRWVQMKKEG